MTKNVARFEGERQRSARWTLLAFLTQGCGGWDAAASQVEGAPLPEPRDDGGASGDANEPDGPARNGMSGLHAVGGHLENGDGKTIVLHGVNRSGTEYRCIQTGGLIFEGPSTEASIEAMVSWKVNAVRVPLNEACWLAINGAPEGTSGEVYKGAIVDYVALLQRYDIVPILDLHWVGPGDAAADRLQPLPDQNAAAFWADVATTFRGNDSVIFEPFNEPFPDGNNDTAAAWSCWQDGCTSPQAVAPDAGVAKTYPALGVQALVNAIRSTGATNLILLGGVQYSNALSQWLTHKPEDPVGNLGAAWHVYNNNLCRSASCWDNVVAKVAAVVPVVATEIGENDCDGAFIAQVMSWLDAHGIGYLAWTWDVYGTGACRPTAGGQQGQPFPLIVSYDGTPKGVYGETFRGHLLGL
jgi:endoglucanase